MTVDTKMNQFIAATTESGESELVGQGVGRVVRRARVVMNDLLWLSEGLLWMTIRNDVLLVLDRLFGRVVRGGCIPGLSGGSGESEESEGVDAPVSGRGKPGKSSAATFSKQATGGYIWETSRFSKQGACYVFVEHGFAKGTDRVCGFAGFGCPGESGGARCHVPKIRGRILDDRGVGKDARPCRE